MASIGRDVNELLGIVRVDYFGEGKDFLGDVITLLTAAARYHYFAWLVIALHRMKDDVLLQNTIVAESRFTGLKNVEAAKFEVVQEVFAERAEVRPIAKAPGSDANELPLPERATDESSQ